jgi:UDP-N-acetylglucosamine diphosphorylase/glucosamine-1-phosphate N-acetyltransferase
MSLAFIILAAGKGTRMESDLAKVLHPLCGKPLVVWVLEAAYGLQPARTVAVVGHQAEKVQTEIATRFPQVEYARQTEMLGTGHAVQQVEPVLANFEGDIIVTCGDAPLISTTTFEALVNKRRALGAAAAMLYATVENPGSYGRVIRDGAGRDGETVTKIVEAKDASDEEKLCPDINAGTYCFESRALWEQLKRIDNKNKSGEYYLTDVVGLLTAAGQTVAAVQIAESEMVGINTKAELLELENQLRAGGRCGNA